MKRLVELEVFVKVVEQGSFTAAASELGIAKSYASKLVAGLEERLGAQLLFRTTRKLSLTDSGRAFYEQARRIVADLDEAENAVVERQAEPRGTLRISAPSIVGREHVAPVVARIARQHPALRVELSLSDHLVDLVGEGYDLVVRIGELSDSSLIARRLASTRVLTCASPEYLQRCGTPSEPAELRGHACLPYTLQATGSAWVYGQTTVQVDGPFRSDSGGALLDAAAAGLGIVRSPDFLAATYLAGGSLVRILEDHEEERGMWALYPPARHLSPKVRVTVDALAAHMAQVCWVGGPSDEAA